MQLVKYLNHYFYTLDELLDLSKVDKSHFYSLQQRNLMPKCSYALCTTLRCDSFLSQHNESQEREFYAKGYVAWLSEVSGGITIEDAKTIFKRRYYERLLHQETLGLVSKESKFNTDFDQHIKNEWVYFIDGTYGSCTKTGLPEDIADKELAISLIKPLIKKEILNQQEERTMVKSVDLLDKASAMFAPHERSGSSRERYINKARRKFIF